MQSILGFCDGLPEHAAAAGEVLLREGETTGRIFILIEGAIDIVKGTIPVHETEEPGAVFGEISALLGIPHTATVKARTPCRLFAVDGGDAFLRRHRDLSYHLARLLAQRLHNVTSYLADLKSQFEDRQDHLGMVGEVLETLLHRQDEMFLPGSDRHPDPTI